MTYSNSHSHDSIYGAVIVAVPLTFGPSRSAWANRSAYRQL